MRILTIVAAFLRRPHHGTLVPRYVIMSTCAATDGAVYLTTLDPFTAQLPL